MKRKILSLSLFLMLFSCTFQLQAQEYVQQTDLPTIYIETEGGRPIVSKEDYVDAVLHYVDSNGVKTYDALGVRGRGNSTWNLDKKPYRIKFAEKQEFMGPERAKAKSWTLLANFADKTLLRNAVAACIGDFAGQPFTAGVQFVDLILNGTYLGNYQLSDQMEVRKKRVDIDEQDKIPTEGANITGGYFLEVDGFGAAEPVHYKTKRNVLVTVKSPDEEVIIPRQIEYIKNHMQLFEDALFSSDFADPEKGYRPYVDSLTLASWYISTELTGNVDGFWSTYMYKKKDDQKFYWGPLWDYDIAFNNCNRVGDVSESLMINKGFGGDLTQKWVLQMWKDPWFVQLINRTWKEYLLCENRSGYEKLRDAYAAIWDDLDCVPVCDAGVRYENSWMFERTYGGARGHEGCDLMPPADISDYYEVVSMTDGVVEQVGWLPLGGWRIGIRSPSGGYFYYAHLSSYSRAFSVGERVTAGETLGMMGDTGYGEEGTSGKFAVHLHLGIYIRTEHTEELSVNPYWILRFLE